MWSEGARRHQGGQSDARAPAISLSKDSAGSTTQAGIAHGTLIVGDGSGSAIARGVSELQQDGLKPIFDERQVAERLELGQLAGQVGFTAAGDLAAKQGWAEGSKEKILLHGAVGAAAAALGGGNALQGLSGAAASQLATNAMQDYLRGANVDPDSAQGRLLMELGSTALGAAVGGGSGAATALVGEQFNRQLHPKEYDWIQENAEGFAAAVYGCGTECSPEQIAAAKDRLTYQAARQVDDRWAYIFGQQMLLGQDGPAQAFLSQKYDTVATDGFTYFAADAAQRSDSSLFADKLRGTPALGGFYDSVLGLTTQPGDEAYLLRALNRTDAGWANDYVGGVLRRDAWSAATMYTGDVGFAAELGRKVLEGDGEGAAKDLATAIIVGRTGVLAGQVIAKAREPVAAALAKAPASGLNAARSEARKSTLETNNFYRDGAAFEFPKKIRTTSGVQIMANPDRTTTILGAYVSDTKNIIEAELSLPKSTLIDGPPQPGSFNLLNTPDSVYKSLGAEQFWEKVNRPWLDAAIARGDDIFLATRPDFGNGGNIFRSDGTYTGFGREVSHLRDNGYIYDEISGRMVKP